MLAYLDTNVVIYFIEQPTGWGPRTTARMTSLRSSGDRFAVSDLTRMECQVGPLSRADSRLLKDFKDFFSVADVLVLPLTPPVFDRAALIRATHRFKPLDSLHLATAVEHGCHTFLTSDAPLSRFQDLTVEILS